VGDNPFVERERAREELQAALEARKELGPSYEPELVERFLERVERRLEERRPQRTTAVDPVRLALGSIALGIPITAISVGNHNTVVALVAWIAIAVVNLAVALSGRSR
jgi:hypothetical protein